MMENPNELLANLVRALDETYWSSWQTLSRFRGELDKARAYVERLDRAEGGE